MLRMVVSFYIILLERDSFCLALLALAEALKEAFPVLIGLLRPLFQQIPRFHIFSDEKEKQIKGAANLFLWDQRTSKGRKATRSLKMFLSPF